MKLKSRQQMSESFFLGALLAVVGGFLDAYTYLLRGHVFANAQTGNIVLLGLHLAQLQITEALYYLIPILAFALGVVVSQLIRRRYQDHDRIHWRQVTLGVECVILLAVAFLPHGRCDMTVNVVISLSCAMQVESFRKINGNTFATTMCTGNLRSATELLFCYAISKNKEERNRSLQYYGIILFFISGAVLGTLLSNTYGAKSVLFCCAVLAIAFVAMFIREELPKMENHSNPKG